MPRGRRLRLFHCVLAVLITLAASIGEPCSAAASGAPVPLAAPPAPAAPLADAAAAGVPPLYDERPLPDQYGVSAEYGYTFDPRADITFLMARVFAIYDYGTVWRQDRPKSLRFKVEGAVGSTLTPKSDLMVSANMLALYYPGRLTGRGLRPYLEAGIGAIYTQFRVDGQAYHFNFNPLLGVGCELPRQNGSNPFAAIRLHHLSNAGIGHDNRGVNSVELQIGRYF